MTVDDYRTAGRCLVLYGAGGSGLTVSAHLRSHGIAAAAFLDAAAIAGQVLDGLPVHTLSDWVNGDHHETCDVIITIHNPFVDVAPIITSLRNAGFARVLSMTDYMNLFPNDPAERYWLTSSSYYADKQELINRARSVFTDDLSKLWFDAALSLRIDGDYLGLPAPCHADQYMPDDLPRWPEPIRLIDCGAYDGDTVAMMLDRDYDIEALIAFEPEVNNYAKLSTRFADLNATFIPCGVSSKTALARFGAGLGPSSRIGEYGETSIQCISIDEALPSFAPTLIKMDIEGAEPAALRGAQRTLARHRPGLAISVYHKPEHIWEVPLWLAECIPDYRMYLRGHGHSGYDMVLYCRTD